MSKQSHWVISMFLVLRGDRKLVPQNSYSFYLYLLDRVFSVVLRSVAFAKEQQYNDIQIDNSQLIRI